MSLDSAILLNKARNCLALEIEAIRATAESLDGSFVAVIQAIHDTVVNQRKLIFTGVGKNIPVCQKLVGTFNSTGVPACFLDPNQAWHGDLGLCSENDLLFLLSNSGQTEEMIKLVPLCKRMGVKMVAITAVSDSALTANTDFTLIFRSPQEACPLNLAPTASTTATLALGDALAMTYLELRGFTREDFAKLHPGGNLGKSLLLHVNEIMRTGERFACRPQTCSVHDAIIAISQAKCGIIALTDVETGRLSGVFSDGDFRRSALSGDDFLHQPVERYMSTHPKTVSPHALAVDVLKIFESSKINDLIVVDTGGKPVGMIDGQDLPKLKIV